MKKIMLVAGAFFLVLGLSAQQAPTVAPVFPPEFSGLIYVEGEDAVSTNFAQYATLDYGSSAYRVLQLKKGPDAPGAPFFAEYVFSVEETGDYEFWIGGTPLGPRDALSPSYASPIGYTLDGEKPVSLGREDTNVVEQYSLINYWSKVKIPVHLTKGTHTIRFVVSEKRRYDNDYYFSIDAFFFLKSGAVPPPEVLPPAFPKNRDNRTIDKYYLSVDEYEYTIQTSPKTLATYLELSKVYSLVGDYQNALKTLARARVNVGDDPQITLLMAKNRVWSGDLSEGLDLYRNYLKVNPKDLAVWSEAAKEQAWQGQYTASLDTYRQAMAIFPDDLNLVVNYGLTYLWANRIKEGEAQLTKAWSKAEKDPFAVERLGQIYFVNGYPDKASDTYQKATERFPANVGFFLLLEDSLAKQGMKTQADEVEKRILTTFQPSEKLTALIDNFRKKEALKQAALDAYLELLKAHPDDLKLREELVQAYYWTGLKDKAINETRNILVNELFIQFGGLDTELLPSYKVLDEIAAAKKALGDQDPVATKLNLALADGVANWNAAVAEVKSASDPASTAKAKADLVAAQTNLAAIVDQADEFLASTVKIRNFTGGLAAEAAPELAKLDDDSKTLRGYLPWTWNRDEVTDELTLASNGGLTLADYLLARLALDDDNTALASVYTARLKAGATSLPVYQTMIFQGQLWRTGAVDPDKLAEGPYFPYSADLSESLKTLGSPVPPVTREFSDTTPARAQELLKTLDALPAALRSEERSLGSLQAQVHHRIQVRVQVQFYRYDLQTLDLRYQLGSYLLDQDRYEEARVQLDRALVMSPENVYIQFDLGRAKQMSGDWSGAMDLYKTIYQTNPKFDFTASSYNQLAKDHSDQVTSQFTSFVDDARDTTQGTLNYHFSGNSLFSGDAAYILDNIRIYQQTSAVIPGSINLQTFTVTPKISFNTLGLSFWGKVGGAFQDNLLGASIPSSVAIQPTDPYTSYLGISPVAGAGGTWLLGPVTWDFGYTFDQVKDTFLYGQTPYFENAGDTTVTVFFAMPDNPWVQSVGSRTYLRSASLFSPDTSVTNTMVTASEEVDGTINLIPEPMTNLTLSAVGSWDNSGNPSETSYYSPNDVTILKGGVQLATLWRLGDKWSLSVSGRGAAGSYTNATSNDLLTEEAVRADITAGNMTLSLGFSSSQSTQQGQTVYWSDQAFIGVHIGLPNYLIH